MEQRRIEFIRTFCWRILSKSSRQDPWAFVEDVLLYFIIFLNTVLAGLFSFSRFSSSSLFSAVFIFITEISVAVLAVEWILKFWSCTASKQYAHPIRGRFKFCTSIFSIVDLIVILAFLRQGPLVNLIFLQLIRIPKLSSYLGAEGDVFSPVRILKNSFINKKEELAITVIFSSTLMFFCSFLIFFFESRAQPEVFYDITLSLRWVFSVLTGAPIADYEPITLIGKGLHVIMIILGVVVVGLPVGILTGSFISEIDDSKKSKALQNDSNLILNAFRFEQKITIRNLVKDLGFPGDRKLLGLDVAMARLEMSQDQIFKACRFSSALRIRACKQDLASQYEDNLVIEAFPSNEPFGCFIGRKSKIHVISSQSAGDLGVGHFSRMLAALLDANYYSNEFFSTANLCEETQVNFALNRAYNAEDPAVPAAFYRWFSLLQENIQPDDLVLYIGTSGAERMPGYHLLFGGGKGQEGFETVAFPTFSQISQLQSFFEALSASLKSVDLPVVTHAEFANTDQNHLSQVLRKKCRADVVTLFVSQKILQSIPLEAYYRIIKDLSVAVTDTLILPKSGVPG